MSLYQILQRGLSSLTCMKFVPEELQKAIMEYANIDVNSLYQNTTLLTKNMVLEKKRLGLFPLMYNEFVLWYRDPSDLPGLYVDE